MSSDGEEMRERQGVSQVFVRLSDRTYNMSLGSEKVVTTH